MIRKFLISSLLLIHINLTFGKFHCRTFPENIDGLITLTTAEYRSFFIICQAGSNDNPHDELELTLRHFDRGTVL